MKRRSRTQERFVFETPDEIHERAERVCVELDREYPYIAEFHLENDGTYTLFALTTIKRSISRHYGEGIGITGWDVDWIEQDGLYCYHQSSGGGSLRCEVSGIYWRAPEMLHAVRERTSRYCGSAFRKRNRTRRLKRIPIDLDGHDDLMRWLENTAIESESYYCQICEEHLLDREEDWCEHVTWCDTHALLVGPGGEYALCEEEDCWGCRKLRQKEKGELCPN